MNTAPATDRARVAASRAVRRTRGAHRTVGDAAYIVYVGLLVTASCGVPVVRTIVLALATPEAMRALSHSGVPRVIAALGALLWVGALLLGRQRGPVAPPPFVARVLGGSDISPTAAWGRDVALAVCAVVLAFGGIGALAVSGFLVSGTGSGFVIGSLLYALPTAAIWLAGQVLSRRAALALLVALGMLVVLAIAAPALPLLPPMALAALWPAAGAAVPGAAGAAVLSLAVFGAAAVVSIALLLRRILPRVALDHALRWEAMTVLATTGDISGALDRTRAQPTSGRRMRIPFSRPLVLAVLQRCAVGVLRTPLRVIIAVTALTASGAGWAWFSGIEHGPRWAVAVGLGLTTFAALGVFSPDPPMRFGGSGLV